MEQLIYIEQNDKNEALMLTRGFTLDEIRTRAYVNALGVELAMKYLAQENICVSNIYNIHNINKIRENFDIADIMLPNIHIDVRVVYDENVIFIPKSHFEYNLVPDIYLVFKMAEESTHVEFLGFFEPKLINKNNQNSDYYFIEKEKLSYASDLKNYIENFHGNTTNSLTETEMETAQRMAISLIDDDLAINDKKTLLELLTKSSSLREKLIEYDNFEWISFHTTKGIDLEDIDNLKNSDILTTSNEIINPDEFEFFEQKDEFEQFESEKDVVAHEEETLASAEDESFEMNMEEDTLTPAEDESFEMNMEEDTLAPAEDESFEMNMEEDTLAPVEDESFEMNMEEDTLTPVEDESFEMNMEEDTLTPVEDESFEMNMEEDTLAPVEDESFEMNMEEDTLTPAEDESFEMNMEEDTLAPVEDESFEMNMEEDTLTPVEDESFEMNMEEDTLAPVENESFEMNMEEDTLAPDEDESFEMNMEEDTLTPAEDESFEMNMEEDTPTPVEDESFEMNMEEDTLTPAEDESFEMNMEEDTLTPVEDESFEMNMEEDTLAPVEDESFEMNMEEEVPLEDVVIEEDALLASLEDEIDTAETTLSVPNDEELFTTNDLSDVEIDIVEDEVKEEITNTEDILLETDNENSSLSELSQPNSVEDITEISENINLSENALIENMIEDEVKDTPHSKEVTEEMISEVLAQGESTGSMSLDALSTIYDVNYENNEEYSNTESMASLEQLATFFNMEEENTISETTNKEKDKVQDIPVIPNKTPQKLNVYENSTIISNENMIIGEIFIDINQMVANENYEINTSTKSLNKNAPKVLVAVGMIIAVLAGWYFFSDFNNKPQEQIPENTPQNPVENNLNEEIDGNIFGEPAEQETMENIEKIIPADKIQFDEVIKETKKEVSKPSKTPPALSPYLEVNSLSWSVPDYLSYNENFKNYLQTTGKSLKLSMSSDLLLVTEYAYSNIIHVTITLAPTGTLQNAQITKSSGSEQIDKIVLRTVNETLNVLKAPSGLIVGDSAKLVLKINL